MTLEPFLVDTGCDLEDLKDFGVRIGHYDGRNAYERSHGRFWKPAGWLYLYDDGRLTAMVRRDLTEVDRRRLAGTVQHLYRGGAKYARERKYRRVRKSKKAPVAYYRSLVWVPVSDQRELEELAVVADGDMIHRAPTVIDSQDQRDPLPAS